MTLEQAKANVLSRLASTALNMYQHGSGHPLEHQFAMILAETFYADSAKFQSQAKVNEMQAELDRLAAGTESCKPSA